MLDKKSCDGGGKKDPWVAEHLPREFIEQDVKIPGPALAFP
jgi:hypothetical protein